MEEFNGERLAELIFILIWNNIASDDTSAVARAVKNRFIGFRSELEFTSLCRNHNKETFSGGSLMPLRAGQATLSAPVYFTFDFHSPERYTEIYRRMAETNMSKLIYITADTEKPWKNTSFFGFDFPTPQFKCYDFQFNGFRDTSGFTEQLDFLTRHFTPRQIFQQQNPPDPETRLWCLEMLREYPVKDLLSVYLTRLIFDGFIGFSHYRGIPSDIDCIVRDSGGKLRLYEIKEKDVSKTHPKGFGIDVQRLNDCIAVGRALRLPYIYMVRHIDNQKERNFLGWRFILMEEFADKTDPENLKNGGTGMNTFGNGSNPTSMLGLEHFRIFNNQ
ncbi:hypothetical protein [Mucilaginibacter conchicola]|nr:hypothetical protein [Mucilaginibacter conchicola]